MKAIGLWCGVMLGTLALAGTARAVPETLAYDEAGNYTPATFVNGANLGTGFGAWDLWNKAAELGDSTEGGGGDLNSTNGYSFRFMGDGATGWCNGKRNFDGALQTGDVLSFTFTYNYDGGGRGVDIFSASGQFANLIDVSPGNTFKVNGQTLSTDWSPGAVVAVDITQLADGIQLHLVRTTNGTENLNYTTNILNAEPATGFSLYCGGYETNEFAPNNVDFAIFMNDIQIVGEPRTILTFTSGTWNPSVTGDYEFVLSREGAVGDDVVLSSSNPDAVTVPAGATFVSNSVSFNATVVSLTNGPATIVASNEATGAWANYVITPVPPVLGIGGPWEIFALGPAGYVLQRVGAVGDTIALSSSAPGVLTVPATATFVTGETQTTFNATAVAFGAATILASNAASGAWATYDVTVAAPALALSGPTNVWTGATKVYAVSRNSEAGVGATVNLSSSDTNALAVPATVDFAAGQNRAYFLATSLVAGAATITADNDDVEPATLDVVVADMPGILASDEAGNYTPASFTNGANEGTGFGAWELWNRAAELGDSTAGGGGDLNSTNGYSFQFMADGLGGWCNGKRYIAGAMQAGEVLSFTFTYNYDGGGRGVDIFSASGQFANLIDVSPGNTFKVNGQTLSTDWSPGAVVAVDITQLADGIQLHLVRTTNGTENLNYTTNILNAEPATGFSLYCGGYETNEFAPNNVDFAIFMNDIQIVGEPRTILTFTSGTWNPSVTGDYEFVLSREGAVGDDVVLSSSNPDAVTVPAGATFVSNSVSFNATVVSLTNGPATIVASNEATGAWANYVITPVPPVLGIGGPWEIFALGPAGYVLQRVGAVGDTIALSSSAPGVLTVPATATFVTGETQTTFNATAVAFGAATILASNAASGAWATYDVTVAAPALALSGPTNVWTGATKVYAVSRNSEAGVGATVNLSSSDTNALAVPATVDFAAGQNRAYFLATSLVAGAATITADNDDVEPATLDVVVADMPGILASDEAGNYTPASFTNGANEGTGFGAWELWNRAAELGDSTAGGGGDLNSTNGYSFQFMADGLGGWCNGKRYIAGAMQAGEVLSFTFTYNYDGGGRGVDIFSAAGQFANLIDVSPGNVFKVNGTTISTDYSPGAVVDVEITQQAGGIQMYLTRTVAGVPNLAYVTNIVHGDGVTGVSLYCGGYVSGGGDNVNYAIFMNDLRIVGEERTSLTFTGGTWNPAATGDYPFELTRTGGVTDEIVLTSDNEAAATVPASVTFVSNQVSFDVTVVSLTAGNAKIVASNAASGAWAEYVVYPVVPTLSIGGPWLLEALGATSYTLTRSASVGTNVLLSSSDTNVLWVPAGLDYEDGVLETNFPATALAYGTATITATDVVSGAWATYDVTVQLPADLPIPDITFSPATGNFSFAEPTGYDLYKVYGADCALNGAQGWDWVELVLDTDYAVSGGVVTILTDAAARQIIRVSFVPE